jgi:cellobiose-specific phosphotransferase system component IIB
MDANNVGFTILSEMMDLVAQSTNKLVDNIEEEDYANIRDKKVVKRDLDILVHAYSNILEVLGEYYVKLEK